MPIHEFAVKTLEIDWLAPIFGGVHLTGQFINGTARIAGEAVLSVKGNAVPQPNTTTAVFRGGTPPRLRVEFAHDADQNIFRSLMLSDWSGFSILFEDAELDPSSPKETSVAFKKVKFNRTF
jgi:hypothetical protein